MKLRTAVCKLFATASILVMISAIVVYACIFAGLLTVDDNPYLQPESLVTYILIGFGMFVIRIFMCQGQRQTVGNK